MDQTVFEYDDSKLQQMFAELEPKRRKQALKGAIRKEANRVRKTAVGNLRDTGIKTNKGLEKGIRSVVFKKTAGFRVTIGTKRTRHHGERSGWRKSFAGQSYTSGGKPWELVLIWNEKGTKERRTKDQGSTRFFCTRKRKGHSTGRITDSAFMGKTLDEVKGSVTADLHKEIRENVVKTSKKYGCK